MRQSGRAKTDPAAGFTLMEVMVALIVATLIVGGVMGAISAALQYTRRVEDKSQGWPILEAAAQEILSDPEKAEEGVLALKDFPDNPEVEILLQEVYSAEGNEVKNAFGRLYRVQLRHEGNVLELSLIIPESSL